ncbi:PH domain protein [Aspergillus clavatus NRRL 1]|uniref:PH domain protein n=1 Tax=Aspergillus clavatus (strain ATCC 1007 / CBS 513.65 / DSM 816 / NCTC 3887 / NRRL 1 / QM 1276 / 107) TaxID=344612 RepID=A1CRF2_ASPCL|nr:PH domain protein [Aspergillus clavatus NRRL 1]EAW08223.1 PH domain protein [Aspergillus clavatus NRRL 1]
MSAFGGSSRKENAEKHHRTASASIALNNSPPRYDTLSLDTPSPIDGSPLQSTTKAERRMSRPASTIFTHDPPFMELSEDTPPELQPIFTFLNNHANKLYHEGYFLKLNDLDNHGRPYSDRQWVECYAQLIGTVLSVWDAAALDAAAEGEEVPSTFINLADGSIKVAQIETLPTRNQAMEPLKNVLSVCSAGQNRYLLHFNSFHSLTQWASAIRLALFEHTSLYEAYTGSIIAGKGKHLNNIRSILDRNRFKQEDWARVRFGAGTPWRRCWFVITPPNEKEYQKAQKSLKKSAYDRAPKMITGDIKFYDTKKTKKAKPIATITNAYSAYAIYPQSKALIDQSTLVKIEGTVTIHSQPESASEGFVFVMPEVHPAISGFEMMVRFLVPTFDTFNLYGRPTRLIAATNHIKSIMFAFPNHQRYGYLDILDVANLMQVPGSHDWTEAEWRKQLKDATARHMAAVGSRTSSISSKKPRFRASLPSRYSNVSAGVSRLNGLPESRPEYNQSADTILHESPKEDSLASAYHARGSSDTTGINFIRKRAQTSALESSPSSSDQDLAPSERGLTGTTRVSDRSSENDWKLHPDPEAEAIGEDLRPQSPPDPVSMPPAFMHAPGDTPSHRPLPSPDLRKMNNRMSDTTLTQLAAAGKMSMASLALHASDRSGIQESDESTQHVSTAQNIWSLGSDSTDSSSNSSREALKSQEQTPPATANPNSVFGPPLVKPTGNNVSADPVKVVKRKPLPSQQPKELDSQSPAEPTYDDLRHTVDEEVLNWVTSRQLSFPSTDEDRQVDDESVYDDASTTSPDYASTHESVYSKKSVRSTKPRMGVMKTVGMEPKKDLVIGDAHYSLDQESRNNSDIPTVDFGPTLTYLPTTGRPSTSDTLKKSAHHRTDSDATEKQRYAVPTHLKDLPHSRSPSQDEFRRSMLWQPGMAATRPVTPGGLTPEQFVQQRAAPSPPIQVHHHRTTSTTPPPRRPLSGDWMAHTRSQSQMTVPREPHPRPRSRGASSMLNYNDISSHLSAREQEHVARMTGSSFFNISSEKSKQSPPVDPMGLVGAIDAREREKKHIKEGMSNQMVQHAIAQRQQHWQHQQLAMTPPANYGLQSGQHSSVYNLPAASHTWDALNQSYHADEPRRQSWFGPYNQPPQTPPMYPPTQPVAQPTGYFSNGAPMQY